MNATAMPNRHPVDQLAETREQIKKLEATERELRGEVSRLMGGADSLGGDEWIARQSVTTRKGSIDEAAMRACDIDPDDWRKPDVTVYAIRLERRAIAEDA